MMTLKIHTHKGSLGWHAKAETRGRRWGTDRTDEATAVYRAALAAFFGPIKPRERLFSESISVFVYPVAEHHWVAVHLDVDTMANECRQLLQEAGILTREYAPESRKAKHAK